MSKKPSIFSFESGCNIRAISIDNTPWFVAADVCKAIGIRHSASAMRALDSDEKGVHSMHTPGGHQDFTIISESGLYTLILRCRDAVTPGTLSYRFRKWVTSEVLPAIRKTSEYSYQKSPATTPPAHYRILLTMEGAKVIDSVLVPADSMLLHPDDAIELAKRAGNVLLPYQELRRMGSEQIMALCDEAAKRKAKWDQIYAS